MSEFRTERPHLDLGDVPADDVEPADVAERLETDPEEERNRTDPDQTDTLDHPS